MAHSIMPPFNSETAKAKVQVAEDLWNTREPERSRNGLYGGFPVA